MNVIHFVEAQKIFNVGILGKAQKLRPVEKANVHKSFDAVFLKQVEKFFRRLPRKADCKNFAHKYSSLQEDANQIIFRREQHQHEQKRNADALSVGDCLRAERLAPHRLDK